MKKLLLAALVCVLSSCSNDKTDLTQNTLVVEVYDIESREMVRSIPATHINMYSHNRVYVYSGDELVTRITNAMVVTRQKDESN